MKKILIRAEDKNDWERRTPLIPADVRDLSKTKDVHFLVEKSPKRAFRETEYTAAGAVIVDEMAAGDIVLGIKEIPEAKILDNKIYLFFSHTVKGQASNMPMLQQIIDGKSTLIDYERIENEQARRLIYFGNYAGHAGAIDILWLMGEYWQSRGLKTPFGDVQQALNYPDLESAKNHLQAVGKNITESGFPQEICPMIVGILGYGNVSKGVQEVFDYLPVERIQPADLPAIVQKTEETGKIYLVIFQEKNLVTRKDGQAFELQHYYQHPEAYRSQFDQHLAYLNILVNAVYWDKRYPRFVTWENLRELSGKSGLPRLAGISDITCDVNGSIECNLKTTDSGMPAYLCHPATQTITDGHQGEGIVLLAVDNLPAELPVDSSTFFSRQLKNFIPNLINADFTKPLQESGLRPEIQKAVIVYQGKLTEPYQYLKEFIRT